MEFEKTPLSNGYDIPLVSIVAVCYNHSPYVQAAVESLLKQDYPRLEIIISDDCSTDDSVLIIQSTLEKYQGPHHIIFNVNPTNLGIGGNVAKAQSLASGELMASADCDDISAPTRISELVSCWLSQNKPPLITSDAYDTKESGEVLSIKRCDDLQNIKSIPDWQDKKPLFFGCTNMYSRELVEKFTPLQNGCGATDQIMVLRSILVGRPVSLHSPLVYHRRGGITGNKPKSIQEKIKRWLKDTPKSIADMEQQILDAESYGQGLILKQHYLAKLAEAHLIQTIFSPEKIKYKYIKILRTPHISLFKKIRYLGYVYLPNFLSHIYKLKSYF